LRPALLVFGLILWINGCISSVPILPENQTVPIDLVELTDTLFFPQKAYLCGPAALATLLSASGIPLEPDVLIPKVYLPEKKGSLQPDLLAASRRYGRIPYVIDPDLSAILEELYAGRPVLVLQNIGFKIHPVYHYAVVVGIDLNNNHLILRSGKTERLVMDTSRFIKTWRRADSWGLVLLKPGKMPARLNPNRYLQAVAAMEAIGRSPEAELGYRAALRRLPADPVALFGLGNSLLGQSRYLQAEQTYRHLLSIQPENKAAMNNLAETMMKQGHYQDALEIIDRAVKIESGDQEIMETCLQTRVEILKLKSFQNK